MILVGWHRAVYEIWQRRRHPQPGDAHGLRVPDRQGPQRRPVHQRPEPSVDPQRAQRASASRDYSGCATPWCSGSWIGAPASTRQVEGRVSREGSWARRCSYLTSEGGAILDDGSAQGPVGQSHQIRDPDAPMSSGPADRPGPTARAGSAFRKRLSSAQGVARTRIGCRLGSALEARRGAAGR